MSFTTLAIAKIYGGKVYLYEGAELTAPALAQIGE
jgi:hypothetical protein